MLSFINSLIQVTDVTTTLPGFSGNEVWLGRDLTGSYWYVVQFDDAGSDVNDWFTTDPCHFGPAPA